MFGGDNTRKLLLAGYAILVKLIVAQGRVLAPMVDAKDPSFVIPGQYIIVLNDGEVHTDALLQHEVWLTTLISAGESEEAELEHKFKIDGLEGYSGKFSERMIAKIRERPEVKYVEPDQIMYALDMVDGKTRKSFLKRASRNKNKMIRKSSLKRATHEKKTEKKSTVKKQMNAPWGISRVSHGDMPTELSRYHYPRSAGKGVDVYVIDTGINIAHADFEGRAKWGATIPFGDMDIDGNGHGTHCAGTIASKTYGIAKKAHVIAVKVLRTNGFGTNADVIKGVEWAIDAAKRGAKMGRRSAANMSLGGGRSLTLENVVNKAVKNGVHFSVAAGNDNEDACEYSPAGAEGPVTVGASTNRDAMAFFSNHGPCVDIFAPGMDITSTWIGSRRAVNTISGTSMAAPHVAGVLALYLSEKEYTPKELKKVLIEHANSGLLEELPDETINRLLSTRRLLEALVH
jgi:cerevisin